MAISSLLLLVCLGQSPPDRIIPVAPSRPYRVALTVPSGMALTGTLHQGETDLAITVIGDQGQVAVFDSRERGAELFAFVPVTAGRYWVEIRTVVPSAPGGSFRLALGVDAMASQVMARTAAARQHTDAKALFHKGDRDSLVKAIDLLTGVRSLWKSAGSTVMELAAISGTGDAYYTMSAFAQARASYADALALSRDLADIRSEAEILNNLAMVSWPLGDIQTALASLDAAEDRWRRLKFTYGEAIAVNNRGILLWESGDYDDARQAYRRALGMFERIGETRGMAYALNNMGVLLEALGEREEALRFLARAVALFDKVGDQVAKGRAEVRRARIYLDIGNRTGAWKAVARAMNVLSKSADKLAEADAIAQRARVLAAEGRAPLARFEMHRALGSYQALDSRRGISDALHEIGRSHLDSGDAANAVGFLTESLEIRRALGLKSLEAETLFALGRAEWARQNLELARRYLESAIMGVEGLRSGVLEKQLRAKYADSKRQYYDAYISVLLDAHTAEPEGGFDRIAFEASERAKSRGLAELLRESWSQVSSDVPSPLRQQEETLRRQINYWSWQLWQRSAQAGTETARHEIQVRLTALAEAHDAAVAEIRRADPRFAGLLAPQHIAVYDVQQTLRAPGAALVAYHLLEDASAVWVVTAERVDVRRLASRQLVEEAARSFVARVASASAGTAGRFASGQTLRRIVFEPVEALVEASRIMFAPDGALHAVPWSALPTQRGFPLILSHEVSVTPSATVFTMLTRETAQRPRAERQLAAIGDPVFDRADPRVRGSAPAKGDGRGRSGFTRLPYSREEVDGILALVPAVDRLRAVDFDASRALLSSASLQAYRMVHFATHAVQDQSHPDLSGIVLSLIDRSGRAQDGFVRLHDLYNLRLEAELVVLSACDTGIGRESSGEGVASLARGLFHAGAARVVSTLWKVDDEATSALMQAFYQQLFSPESSGPAAALRVAQSHIRQQARWRHPYFWAGFILQGTW